MSIHDGHRERMKERFTEHGLDGFHDVNALELLLFYAVPRRDTNELAHALLNRFGSLDAVFSASVYELEEVPGVGRSTAVLISLIPELAKRCAVSRTREVTVFDSSSAIGRYLAPRLGTLPVEHVYLLCLDAQKQLIKTVELSSGVVDSVSVSSRQAVEAALHHRASSVVLAHNHPTGNVNPSRDDEALTRRIRDALALVDIPLDDHIIIGGQSWFSFADSGLLLYHRGLPY